MNLAKGGNRWPTVSEGVKTFSKEHREKLSKAAKGHAAWNKGIPMTDEFKRKVSVGRRRQLAKDNT